MSKSEKTLLREALDKALFRETLYKGLLREALEVLGEFHLNFQRSHLRLGEAMHKLNITVTEIVNRKEDSNTNEA